MRIFEFLIRLFTRFAPVDKETISTLSFQLQDYHTVQTQNFKQKMDHNEKIANKASEIKIELGKLEPNTPEHEAKLFEFTELQGQLEKPTMMERALDFLDKPMIKLALMVAFIFVSRIILKKITGSDKEEIEEEIETPQKAQIVPQPHPQFNPNWQPQFYQPQFQNPYGSGYQYPQQQG